jgi:hypothetical protein
VVGEGGGQELGRVHRQGSVKSAGRGTRGRGALVQRARVGRIQRQGRPSGVRPSPQNVK